MRQLASKMRSHKNTLFRLKIGAISLHALSKKRTMTGNRFDYFPQKPRNEMRGTPYHSSLKSRTAIFIGSIIITTGT